MYHTYRESAKGEGMKHRLNDENDMLSKKACNIYTSNASRTVSINQRNINVGNLLVNFS